MTAKMIKEIMQGTHLYLNSQSERGKELDDVFSFSKYRLHMSYT